jgi:hypothetical protein
MTSKAKVSISIGVTVILLLMLGGRIWLIHKHNTEDEVAIPRTAYQKSNLSDDDMVFSRKERPDSLKDERTLIGKTIWVSAGEQLDYYKVASHHIDYAHPVATLRGAEPLIVKDVFEQVAPKSGPAVARIAGGQKHVLLAFTMPNSADPAVIYATPVGNFDAGNYTFISDDVFFYDDPHVLYKHWGPEMWAHIDKHEVVNGMSENQAMMALGEVIEPHGDKMGDRSVTYHVGDKNTNIRFEHNKAVQIVQGD